MPGVKWTRDTLKGSTKTQGDFNLAHRFTVEIDGVAVGGVHTIEGLEHEHEVVEYHDGDEGVTRFRPGRQKVGGLLEDLHALVGGEPRHGQGAFRSRRGLPAGRRPPAAAHRAAAGDRLPHVGGGIHTDRETGLEQAARRALDRILVQRQVAR